MKGKWFSLSLGIVLMALAGCSSPTSQGDPGPVVYVAGSYYFGMNFRAAYWKDDGNSVTQVVLDDPANTTDSEASDIFVDTNGIVYVSGYYNGNVPVYWTDDDGSVTLHVLPVTISSSANNASGIFVDAGGIVYVSGTDNNGTNDVAVYWVDDGIPPVTKVVLHDASAAHATGIYVDVSGKVYTSGDLGGVVAVYWSDTGGTPVKTDLPGPSDGSAIAVDGSAVYVSGRNASSGTSLAAYWTATGWQDLSSVAGNAWDIVRYSGQTYSVGDYLLPGVTPGRRAAYWRGTNKTDLNGNLSNTYAYGIYIFDGDVYSAGAQVEDNTTSDTEAIYWRNGSVVDLSAGVGSRANAIFVR